MKHDLIEWPVGIRFKSPLIYVPLNGRLFVCHLEDFTFIFFNFNTFRKTFLQFLGIEFLFKQTGPKCTTILNNI